MTEPVPSWASEPGLSQVICGCTGETMIFLISDVAARLLCSRCGAVNGEFRRQPGEPLVTFDDIPPAPPEGLNLPHILAPPDALGQRDTIQGQGGVQAGAAWGFDPYPGHGSGGGAGGSAPGATGSPGGGSAFGTTGAAGGGGGGLGGQGGTHAGSSGDSGTYQVPKLPTMSPNLCNAYLRGGTLDGTITYIPPDVVNYVIVGAGSYIRTLEVHEARTVYLSKG